MDIRNSDDILHMLRVFYANVIPDPVIGHFFTEVVQLDLEAHLPRLTAFWEQVLLGTGNYEGNPMQVHLHLHAQSEIRGEHFSRWLELFRAAVDACFQGPVAEMAKRRAEGIALSMSAKLHAAPRA